MRSFFGSILLILVLAALEAVPGEKTPVAPAEEIPASAAGMPEPAEL